MGLVNYMAMNIIKLQHEVARVDYSNTKQEIFIRDFFWLLYISWSVHAEHCGDEATPTRRLAVPSK